MIEMPIDEELDKDLQSYEERFNDIKMQLSDLRKAGKDTFFADTKMLNFVSLVKLARVTYDPSDVAKVKRLIDDVVHEIEIAKHGEPIAQALLLISQANEKISKDDISGAKADYNVLSSVYRTLPPEEKNLIVEACGVIREKLVQHAK